MLGNGWPAGNLRQIVTRSTRCESVFERNTERAATVQDQIVTTQPQRMRVANHRRRRGATTPSRQLPTRRPIPHRSKPVATILLRLRLTTIPVLAPIEVH